MFDIVDFITRMFKKDKQEDARSRARERLKLVLVSDRSAMSPQMMEALREELIQVISRYMTIDISSMEIGLERNEGSVALAANIPIINLGRIQKKTRQDKEQNLTRKEQTKTSEKPISAEPEEEVQIPTHKIQETKPSEESDIDETRSDKEQIPPGKKDTARSKKTADEDEKDKSSDGRKKTKRSSGKYKTRTRGRSLRRKI
jgi:cell division topological specificity factor